MKIIAHIPARQGSKRLKVKNLLPLMGEPMIGHVIKAGKGSKLLTELYVNTESSQIGDVARGYDTKVFARDEALAQDEVTQDTFNYDFIKKVNPDVLVLLNPVCPLIESSDIDHAIQEFLDAGADCLVTTTDYQLFAIYEDQGINFSLDKILPRTQDVLPIRLLNFAIGVWKAESFIRKFEQDGSACLFGKIIYQTLPKLKSIKVSDQEDFDLVAAIMKNK